MATAEHPITHSELRQAIREELDVRLQHYATKADLAELETRLVQALSSQLRWMLGFQLLGLGAVAAIMRLLG